jgi:DNA-binding SARP family transcriptional activator
MGKTKTGSTLRMRRSRSPLDDSSVADDFALNMLGGFTVFKNAEPLSLPPSCQRVVALAALKRKQVHRQWVCSVLWPYSPPRKAVASLRSALWRLRPLGADALLIIDAQSLVLSPDVSVDWHDSVDLIDRLLTADGPAGSEPDVVAELLPLLRSGDLLQGWADRWCGAERNRYRGMRHAALEALGRGAERHVGHHSCVAPRSAHSRDAGGRPRE